MSPFRRPWGQKLKGKSSQHEWPHHLDASNDSRIVSFFGLNWLVLNEKSCRSPRLQRLREAVGQSNASTYFQPSTQQEESGSDLTSSRRGQCQCWVGRISRRCIVGFRSTSVNFALTNQRTVCTVLSCRHSLICCPFIVKTMGRLQDKVSTR